MSRVVVWMVGMTVGVMLFTSSAWAGGAFLYELGTPDLGTAYEFLDAGSAEIANLSRGPLASTLQGDYSTNHIHFVALNVTWKF